MAREQHSQVLDGMRGLAVLIVMLSHSSGREMPIANWLNFAGIGHIGVYLFFVLSGYLLTRNLLEGQGVGQFYMRRVFRIVPLYYFVLSAVLLYQAYGNYSQQYLHISGGIKGALLHFLFLKGDSVFWTLAAEFGFYLLLPPIVYAIRRFGWGWLASLSVLYFLAFLSAQLFNFSIVPLKFVDIAHRSQFLDVFSCGILAAYISQRWEKKWFPLAFWGLLFLTLICVSTNFMGAGRPLYALRWLSLVYGVVFGLAIISAINGNLALIKPLSYKPLVFAGRIGFGLYLLHFPVFQLVNTYIQTGPEIRFLIALPAAFVLAWGAYELIEVPMIRFGRRMEVRFGFGPNRLISAAP